MSQSVPLSRSHSNLSIEVHLPLVITLIIASITPTTSVTVYAVRSVTKLTIVKMAHFVPNFHKFLGDHRYYRPSFKLSSNVAPKVRLSSQTSDCRPNSSTTVDCRKQPSTFVYKYSTAICERSTVVRKHSTVVCKRSMVVRERSTVIHEYSTVVRERLTVVRRSCSAGQRKSWVTQETSSIAEN